ncbi:MAG: isoleucyl-tRNA synthetase [Candidatus Paceibacteria bacterium]|jgi:isoleucyl-tRNA synthetase
MSKQQGRENDTVEVVDAVTKSEVALREEAIQTFWEEHDIFNKSLISPAGGESKGDFVFYDGPPFATGLPHYGHILPGTIKDAIPRFWTMNGYRVRRKWGWDCHGLPLENLIEKKLGLATKRDIEEYGIKNFNEQARDVVMEYADDWKRIIPRMGRFADMEDDYKTMDSSYTESVWWVFKSLHEKGLVYEGFKSMHLCPRCGTTLSNFEVNQGYKDIKDIAVTVKLPLLDEKREPTDTSLLVWTTTPWTLPGNLAAAVNKEFEYVKCEVVIEKPIEEGKDYSAPVRESVIIAKDILKKNYKQLNEDGTIYEFGGFNLLIVKEMKGSELIGKRYQPPFPYLAGQDFEGKDKAWTIYHADYVELGEDGTGAVHIAPAYGDDDMKLAQAHNVPIEHHVDETGHFMSFVGPFAGQLVKPKDDDAAGVDHKDADIEILKALQAGGKVLKKENITHSYPHCWRCDTPLLNYATTSWFVEVTKIKDKLVAANNKVKWVPEHVGTNRFGKWLDGARDWAVSRQRYWGAPLPIWRNPETKDYKVLGSLAELQEYVPKSGNLYFITRHAESELNTKNILNVDVAVENGITENGLAQIEKLAAELKGVEVDFIYYSPLQRTKETAEKLAQQLGLPDTVLVEDSRLLEMGFGEFEGKTVDEYHAFLGDGIGSLTKRPEGGENWTDVKQRVGTLLYELETTYAGKKILFVSHNGTSQMIQAVATGEDMQTTATHIEKDSYDLLNAELRSLPFVPMPHNDYYELDFHRPYIDDIELFDGGVSLERVPDVFDCWFESGSMPYGQHHYPFENKDDFEKKYFPANFISESVDQTRGWFYSLMVLGVALFGKSPFKQVITNGLVLAEDGKKMSKSLQNYPDPMELANRTGVDAMRFYLLSSPIIKGEDLNFSEKEALELQRKNIGRLHNVLAMYEMFAGDTGSKSDSDNVLDRWIVTRLNQLIRETTDGYKNYELDKATRPITDFIDDLSVWYLRRSRDRVKGDDGEDKELAIGTLRYVLQQLALVMAPVMPFYADYLWLAVRNENDAESVHLAAWPIESPVDKISLEQMKLVREVVTSALEARTKASIKVRQPIASVSGPLLSNELISVVLDELNAKTYQVSQSEVVSIDTTLTPDLLEEGSVRELMRAVQGKRKTEEMEPQDEIELTVGTDVAGQVAVEKHRGLVTKTVGAMTLNFGEVEGSPVVAGRLSFSFTIKKI